MLLHAYAREKAWKVIQQQSVGEQSQRRHTPEHSYGIS